MNKVLKLLTSRAFIVSALMFIEIVLIASVLIFLAHLFLPIFFLFLLSNIIIVIGIINRNYNPMFKIAWLIPVLAIPVCGALFYIMFGRTRLNRKNTKRLTLAYNSAGGFLSADNELLTRLGARTPHIAREALYIMQSSRTDIFEFTETEYLSPGIAFFEKLVSELKKAKNFIFIEYFIINEGEMWETIKHILSEKQNCGVEIRVMYDDMGSAISGVPPAFQQDLRKLGFNVAVFNPYKPSLDKFLNYRDHRKVCIIDGKVAFTGGINIADEYIGINDRFGHWQDSGIMLRGDAVNRITVMYLQMWTFTTNQPPEYEDYMVDFRANHDGYVIPFSDEPLIQDLICESAYINIIANATKYVYICAPYLIIDQNVSSALIRAAKSGIDIKIITPGTPDKKLVYYMTQSNYRDLIAAGVNVYEFTPGFIHNKTIVSDDEKAIVGTANFDYRSFYMHFENGVWLYGSKAVMQAKSSFENALALSRKVTREQIEETPFGRRLMCSLLKVFAPLL
ncbi:MAG: cardiolipin synthase [Oscillospiraceae bacterium]|jgi:cardiolipin synthase|nr:cardiolipin synthase [Oscillospiraceae bacterium]